MNNVFNKVQAIFKQNNLLVNLLHINIGAYLLLHILSVILTLLNIDPSLIAINTQMPSEVQGILRKPWTAITYMFTHADIMHIVINMLWLYWFGKLFLQVFNERQLGALYLMGGLAGGLIFTLAYTYLPYFSNSSGLLTGASASVMAIVFAIAFYKKETQINLLFLGKIRLIYLAIGTIAIDVFMLTANNTGGRIAHIGGAILGYVFAAQMQKGKDITKPITKILDKIANFKTKKPKMKATYQKRQADYDYNAAQNNQNQNIDAILDKLKKSGYQSLTKNEKKQLFDASNK